MTTETIIEIVIIVILFLTISYFIFFKSWLKALGNEIAKLTTAYDLTKITESVKKEFNESLELFKVKLNEDLSLKIEPLKAELAKNNISHQIQYSFLHQERAKVIVELYKKLQELHSAMIDWTANFQPIVEDADKESQERTDRANQAMIDFKNFFIPNRIFFSKTFVNSMDELLKEYWDKGWDFGYKQARMSSGQLPADYFQEYSKELSKISKEIREVFPTKIANLEDRCREILKVEEE